MNLQRKKVIDLWNVLSKNGELSGIVRLDDKTSKTYTKWTYFVGKNKKIIKPEIEIIEEQAKSKEFSDRRTKTCEKYCLINNDGAPKMVKDPESPNDPNKQTYDIDPKFRNQFDEEIRQLYADIRTLNNKLEEDNKLDVVLPNDLIKIKLSEVHPEVAGNDIAILMELDLITDD